LRLAIPGLIFVGLCFVWGSTWLVIKVGLDYLPPFLFAGIRFATASVALVFLTMLLRARIPKDRSSWMLMSFLGIFQISLPYGLVFWGEQYISSGLAAVLFATLPFFVAIFAHPLAGEELTRIKIGGIAVSFIGLLIIFWRDIAVAQSIAAQYSLAGSLAVVGSSASGGLANVVAKRYAHGIDPAANVLVQAIIGTLVLSSAGFAFEIGRPMSFTLVAISSIIYLGIVGTALPFVALYWLLRRMSATNVSLFTFITPIVALALGWLILGEILDPNVGVGAVLILVGVYLTMKPVSG